MIGADLGAACLVAAVGWVVRVPPLSREEGHEAITSAAWEGLDLTEEQRDALIRGVRAPDVSLAGILVTALPFAQPRHALRAWHGTSTAEAVRKVRRFVTDRHLRAMALPDGPRRWAAFGEVLHCLQDSYSPAHVERHGPRITRMRHWGPLDRWRRQPAADEHGFPTDARDRARDGSGLTEAALAAATASRAYLELALRDQAERPGAEARRVAITEFLDSSVMGRG